MPWPLSRQGSCRGDADSVYNSITDGGGSSYGGGGGGGDQTPTPTNAAIWGQYLGHYRSAMSIKSQCSCATTTAITNHHHRRHYHNDSEMPPWKIYAKEL